MSGERETNIVHPDASSDPLREEHATVKVQLADLQAQVSALSQTIEGAPCKLEDAKSASRLAAQDFTKRVGMQVHAWRSQTDRHAWVLDAAIDENLHKETVRPV